MTQTKRTKVRSRTADVRPSGVAGRSGRAGETFSNGLGRGRPRLNQNLRFQRRLGSNSESAFFLCDVSSVAKRSLKKEASIEFQLTESHRPEAAAHDLPRVNVDGSSETAESRYRQQLIISTKRIFFLKVVR